MRKNAPRATLNARQLAELISLVRAKKTIVAIASHFGVNPDVASRFIKPVTDLLNELGEETAAKRPSLTPEQIAFIKEQLPIARTLEDICNAIGRQHRNIKATVQRLINELGGIEALPPCRCGALRYHPGLCSSLSQPGFNVRELAVSAIMSGRTYPDINRQLGLRKVEYYKRYLTPEQRAKRKEMERARRAPVYSSHPYGDPTYSQIAAAMPRWLSDAARDDAISDMYVAYLEGTVSMSDVAAEARRYASRAVNQWESRFGPRSIDEQLTEDSHTTLGDMLVDPSALHAFDYIFEDE